jgi:hypothetical protein
LSRHTSFIADFSGDVNQENEYYKQRPLN